MQYRREVAWSGDQDVVEARRGRGAIRTIRRGSLESIT
jgi:hypothetical protein